MRTQQQKQRAARPCPRLRRGETLVEAMAAILLVTLASLLFLAAITGSARATAAADGADSDFYAAEAALEAGGGSTAAASSLVLTLTFAPEGGAARQIAALPATLLAQDGLFAYEAQ